MVVGIAEGTAKIQHLTLNSETCSMKITPTSDSALITGTRAINLGWLLFLHT